jgi:hypothetical protein
VGSISGAPAITDSVRARPLKHQPGGRFGRRADLDAARGGDRIDGGNDAVVSRAQTLADTRRHGRDRSRRDAALAQEFDPFDRGVVLGDAGVVGNCALGRDAQHAVGDPFLWPPRVAPVSERDTSL